MTIGFAQLPKECCDDICLYLELPELNALGLSCHSLYQSLFDDTNTSGCGHPANNELWNRFLCQHIWTVDPLTVLADSMNTSGSALDQNPWMQHVRRMVEAEKNYQLHLDRLATMDLSGWLDRHFLGQLAPGWNGWEKRFWSWDSRHGMFVAWRDSTQRQVMAHFPLSKESEVRRVSEQEQVALSSNFNGDTNNPVQDPKPFVFTVTNTTFPLLFACSSETELKLWMDKIEVTVHPLKVEGKRYRAPAQFKMERKRTNTSQVSIAEQP